MILILKRFRGGGGGGPIRAFFFFLGGGQSGDIFRGGALKKNTLYGSLIRNQNISFRNTFHILKESNEWTHVPFFTSVT